MAVTWEGRLPIRRSHSRQATLHTASGRIALLSHRIAGSSPFRTQAGIPLGSSSVHKDGSPHEQGRISHAIERRPERAGECTPSSSIHPELGVGSKHQRFQRYAL